MDDRTPICATGATAQGWNWSYGADMTSDYIDSGVSQSDGFAIQPLGEVENSGIYCGIRLLRPHLF
ncbi:MAG: hypothetical protein VX228_14205 [Pseudomonadota bacterium]|nr:hypothetical protein [Pseudomonadota bacterium]